MAAMSGLMEKMKILADSAKYDASCSTSGVQRSNSGKMGNATMGGICHSWSADGRCISLLKILFTNKCVYDCEYCVNRRTADVARASFEPEELVALTMEFYRRNYIEGLFLSSAVEVSPDYTAERIIKALTILRYTYEFSGYIHAKVIPGVSPELVHQIGMLADRVSVNVELPTQDSLGLLAPQKKVKGIFNPMRQITGTLAEQKNLRVGGNRYSKLRRQGPLDLSYLDPQKDLTGEGGILDRQGYPLAIREQTGVYKAKAKFAPAGQTTQMIIGASPESDRQIVKLSESLYKSFHMRRVYFSAYIPVVKSPVLPDLFSAPPLMREHRLYQADWLLRFYGFTADEILDEKDPFLDLELDPKISWALRNIHIFPIEINKAPMEELLRIPGVGNVSATRIVRQRRLSGVKFEDLKKLGVVVKRAQYFITCSGRYHGDADIAPGAIKGRLLPAESIRNCLLPVNDEIQISMFSSGMSAVTKGTDPLVLQSAASSAAGPLEQISGVSGRAAKPFSAASERPAGQNSVITGKPLRQFEDTSGRRALP